MAVGEYKLAGGRANGCAYAHVRREAAAVGVRYAADRCRKRGALRVTFSWVRATHVDTTQMAIAFAAYQAACQAFGVPPDDRVRLRPDRVYEFPA
jgi:hypothetical protein